MTHFFKSELTQQDYQDIRKRLQLFQNQLEETRFINLEKLYNFYKTHNRFPSSISNDTTERNMFFLLKKLQNPENQILLKKELDYIRQIDVDFFGHIQLSRNI
jgi:hypothetical protein